MLTTFTQPERHRQHADDHGRGGHQYGPQPSAPGFATVYPCGQAPPFVSNLNFVAGQIIANAVVATPDAGGRICVHASTPTHLVVDVSGFFR